MNRIEIEDYTRLVDWMADPNRKPAELAFTAGVLRDAAYAFEAAQRRLTPSPDAGVREALKQAAYHLSQHAMDYHHVTPSGFVYHLEDLASSLASPAEVDVDKAAELFKERLKAKYCGSDGRTWVRLGERCLDGDISAFINDVVAELRAILVSVKGGG